MRKVYLIQELLGDSYSSYTSTIDARFNKTEAFTILKDLEAKYQLEVDKFDKLKEHIENCELDECEICEEFYDLQSHIYEGGCYIVKEICVNEIGESLFEENIIELEEE